MSAEKAASLTSSLLAPKGSAKPAALDQDVYRSVAIPVDQSGPTAVVTALHPARDDETPPGAGANDENDAVEGDTKDVAPEAALTDLRVAVEARSVDAPVTEGREDRDAADAATAAEGPSDDEAATEPAAADTGSPTADEADADEPEMSDPDASVADEPETDLPSTDSEPITAAPASPEPAAETPQPAVSVPVAPIAIAPADRLAAATQVVPERRRGRTLLLSGAIFVASAVVGWYAVQNSPSLQAEFRRMAGQIQTFVYGPAAEQPAIENVDGTAAPGAEPAAPSALPGDSTVPAERTAPDTRPSDSAVTPPAPEPDPAPSDKLDSLASISAADAVAPTTLVPGVPVAEAEPSIDLVRISPEGDGIIVGRAAPDAELILLDNGEPIGTVTATPAGEWVFQTDEPLPGGDHNFGVVVKKTYGNVTLPSTKSGGDTPATVEPAAEEQGSRAGDEDETSELAPDNPVVTPPLPLSKPGTEMSDAMANGRFVIQLASVKSTAHAERLWAELRHDFPDLTDGLNLIIDSRQGRDNTAYVRVRTGPFGARANAENYCARFKAGKQDCLVVVALPRS